MSCLRSFFLLLKHNSLLGKKKILCEKTEKGLFLGSKEKTKEAPIAQEIAKKTTEKLLLLRNRLAEEVKQSENNIEAFSKSMVRMGLVERVHTSFAEAILSSYEHIKKYSEKTSKEKKLVIFSVSVFILSCMFVLYKRVFSVLLSMLSYLIKVVY